MFYSILISAALLYADRAAEIAEQPSDTLHAVTLTVDKGVIISRTDTLTINNSYDISRELHKVPGLQIGDYGGFAGIKTLSLRGMGSPHTNVYVDGVRIGNVQTGQGDMGMPEIENFSSAVVDYAQNSISFNTARPVFTDGNFAGKARFYMGSFGTYLPYARLDFKLSDNVSLSAIAAGVISKGDFPAADGSTRTNNDIRQARCGLNLFGLVDNGDYHIKAFYNTTERGTPGSLDWPSDDRQNDMNVYLQGVIKKKFSHLYTLNMGAKAGYDNIYYTSAWGDSEYGQTELQLNTSHMFRITRWLRLSFAADMQWDKLVSTMYAAERLTLISAITGSFYFDLLSFNIAADYAGYFDKDRKSRHAISPSMDFRIHLTEGLDLAGFGRRAYRVPMFNELYYTGYGNPELLPEDAWLTDLGLDFYRSLSSSWNIKVKIDAFYNYLTNKITSAPTLEDPNIWLPFNIGKVRSTGLDIVAGADCRFNDWSWAVDLKYSFQSAIDKTPDSYSFGQQIPYLAKHTVTADLSAAWKGYTLNPSWIMKAGRSDAAGSLADWNTLDISLSKTFVLKKFSLGVNFCAKNLFDCRYELVSGYPMPGRSFIGGVEFGF